MVEVDEWHEGGEDSMGWRCSQGEEPHGDDWRLMKWHLAWQANESPEEGQQKARWRQGCG